MSLQLKLLSIYTTLALMSVNGTKQYLVREDMTDITYLSTHNDTKPWTVYIDQFLHAMGSLRCIESVICHLLRSVTSAEHWCRIPDSYVGSYNYSLENTLRTQRYNITKWLPCGVLVSQKYISTDIQDEVVIIHVNPQLHFNVTFVELHTDSIAQEIKDHNYMLYLDSYRGNASNCKSSVAVSI